MKYNFVSLEDYNLQNKNKIDGVVLKNKSDKNFIVLINPLLSKYLTAPRVPNQPIKLEHCYKTGIQNHKLLKYFGLEIIKSEYSFEFITNECQTRIEDFNRDEFNRAEVPLFIKEFTQHRKHYWLKKNLQRALGSGQQFFVNGEVVNNFSPPPVRISKIMNSENISPTIDFILQGNDGKKFICEVKMNLTPVRTFTALKQLSIYRDAYEFAYGRKLEQILLAKHFSLHSLEFCTIDKTPLIIITDLYSLNKSVYKLVKDMVYYYSYLGLENQLKDRIIESPYFKAIGGEDIFKLFEGRAYFSLSYSLDKILNTIKKPLHREPSYLIDALHLSEKLPEKDVLTTILEIWWIFMEFTHKKNTNSHSKINCVFPVEEFKKICDKCKEGYNLRDIIESKLNKKTQYS